MLILSTPVIESRFLLAMHGLGFSYAGIKLTTEADFFMQSKGGCTPSSSPWPRPPIIDIANIFAEK
jgi:hypothetical protein